MDVKDMRRAKYTRGHLPTFHNKTRGSHLLPRITKDSIYGDLMHVKASYGMHSGAHTASEVPGDYFSKPAVRDARAQRLGKDASRRRRHDLRAELKFDLEDFYWEGERGGCEKERKKGKRVSK